MKFLLFSPLLLSASLMAWGFIDVGVPALSQAVPPSSLEGFTGGNTETTPLSQLDLHDDALAQITSVSQLSDVQPTDWAFQALQSLVERYGCIAGYPDGTFRGNRAATRYELAAALNACLDNISDRFATREDLETTRALQEEFATELATLRGRVDTLEARTATLEAQQFSTTTKLNGEAIFMGAYAVDESGVEPDRFFAGYRARLNFDTSFSGRDRLRIRLQARDVANLTQATGTRMARLGFDGSSGGTFEIDKLTYRFPFANNRGRVNIDAFNGNFDDHLNRYNPFLVSGSSGALSRFGRFNPIFRQGGGTGVTLTYRFSDQVSGGIGYIAPDQPQNPVGPRGGLVEGSYAAMAEIGLTPIQNVGFGLAYARTFDKAGSNRVLMANTGSALANLPFAGNPQRSADHFGVQFTASPADFINFSGWAGYTLARSELAGDNRRADVFNWAVSTQFPDLLGQGNLGYLTFGQQPRIINSRNLGLPNNREPDPNYHLEGGFRFAVNNNISITPGVIVIFNAENGNLRRAQGATDTVIVPVIRTTFSF